MNKLLQQKLIEKISAFHRNYKLNVYVYFETSSLKNVTAVKEGSSITYYLQTITEQADKLNMNVNNYIYTVCYYQFMDKFPEHEVIADAIRTLHFAQERHVKMQFHFRSDGTLAYNLRKKHTVIYFLDNILCEAKKYKADPKDLGVTVAAHELGHEFTPNGTQYTAQYEQIESDNSMDFFQQRLALANIKLYEEIDASLYGEAICPPHLQPLFYQWNCKNINRYKKNVDSIQKQIEDKKERQQFFAASI